MIGTQLFRRHFSITAFVVLVFIAVGFFISSAMLRFAMNRQASQFGAGPNALVAHWIEDLSHGDRVEALKQVAKESASDLPVSFYILDEAGANLSTHEALAFSWSEIKKPTGPYEFLPLKRQGTWDPPGPPPMEGLIRFPGTPPQYLYSVFDPSHGSKMGPPPVSFIIITVGSLFLSVFAGVGFALFLLFRSMREKMALVDSVISELQRGNLKARFPHHRMDELGAAMNRFNKMADEIERLVERLRTVERSRMTLLQDLTHDLRTPVASLKNLLATVEKKNDSLHQAVRTELLTLARREVDYFEKLLEDLIVLAQVSEPSYQAQQERVSIFDLIEDETGGIEGLHHSDAKQIKIESKVATEVSLVLGDSHLIRRMLRNALENAYSFANSEIRVILEARDHDGEHELQITVQDDGPGLTDEALKGFGVRKVSRTIKKSDSGRLSVGLGSVIIKTVAELHRGKVIVFNKADSSGKVTGAVIQIVLPRFLSRPQLEHHSA